MDVRQAVFNTPWYDTHCHIGCCAAAGYNTGAFACDCARGLDIPPFDMPSILAASYLGWMMMTVGENLDTRARGAGYASDLDWGQRSLEEWWKANCGLYKRQETTGVVRAVVRGVRELYGIDLRFEPDMPIGQANEQIQDRYKRRGFYGCWTDVFERLNCVKGVKLVEMPYYDTSPACESLWKCEQDLVVSALRVDAFTTLHLSPEQAGFRLRPQDMGIQADNLEDYLAQVDQALERALQGGMRALKNAYSYFGPLQLPYPDLKAADRYVRTGSFDDYRHFEAAVLRHILGWANERETAYQFHAGVHRAPWCNCEGLVDQFTQYPQVKFVLLHIYPYIREAGCLARMYPNVYLDPCWLSILAPETLRAALREWIGLVPPEKMLYGVDATTLEGWYGGALAAKEILAEVLEEKIRAGELTPDQALDTARKMLHDNPERWYG